MKKPRIRNEASADERTRAETSPSAAPFLFPTHDDHAPRAELTSRTVTEAPTEEALDNGIEESFPASDPVSVSVSKVVPKPKRSSDPEVTVKPG